jgi:hypothetical protein
MVLPAVPKYPYSGKYQLLRSLLSVLFCSLFTAGWAVARVFLAQRVRWGAMDEETQPAEPATDWADLRAQAAKLGITLSQFQQLQAEKKQRLARKLQHGSPQSNKDTLPKP